MVRDANDGRRFPPRRRWLAVLACAVLLGAAPAIARPTGAVPGKVDETPFLDLVSEDDVSIEVAIGGSLLRAILGGESELGKSVAGLESVNAVILELPSDEVGERARKLVRDTERQLTRTGWSRLARIRDEGSDVKVLVLNDEDKILGLVVMVVEDDELVFANIAGTLDLAAIRALGENMDIPGLDELDIADD